MDQSALEILAPAKLNLYLGVREGRDEQGYHQASSLMVAIDLFDTVRIEPADALSVRCVPAVDAPERSNAAWKAAVVLGEALGREPKAAITIEKRIPYKSGLGGASSDAAAVLLGLCKLWGVDQDDPRVADAARAVGADIAFFLTGTPTLLEGRGDVPVETFVEVPGFPVVLVRPSGDGITTGDSYADFDRDPVPAAPLDPLREALHAGDVMGICNHIANNLEPVALRLMPVLQTIHDWLSEQPGVLATMVTGSGSCTFAICETTEAARRVAHEALYGRGWWGRAAHVITEGTRISA